MNIFGSNKELAENKLILLYLIDKLNIAVSNLQITKIILENRFMNYFFLQQLLDELCCNSYLQLDKEGDKSLYTLTGTGKQTLDYFVGHIPLGIKHRIDETAAAIRKRLKKEMLISSDYIPENENEFIVKCKVHEEGFSLIDLNITVGSKKDARDICENWKRHTQAIYQEIIEILLKNRDT